jgi:integrase
MRTIPPLNIGGFEGSKKICTEFAQIPQRPRREVKFPVEIEFKGQRAKIYRPAKGFAFYRISFRMAGKRRMQTFGTYGEAKEAAEKKVRELHNGQLSGGLTAKQSQDAIVAFEQLQDFYHTSGRHVSLVTAVGAFVDSSRKLGKHALGEAVDGFLKTVATVKRIDIKEAVSEFLLLHAPKTDAAKHERAKLSAKYAYNRQLQLNRFADTFPAHAVCDLTKEHIDAFFGSLHKVTAACRNHRAVSSAKARNHYRASIRQFLEWAIRKDYLTSTHRLNDADAMRPERANTAEVQFYNPEEFAALLVAADEILRPMFVMGGLAGLRTEELLRLDWADVWRVEGHIEITAGKAKTRQRRLIEICPALAAWLKPYKKFTSGKLWKSHEVMFQQKFVETCGQANVANKGKKIPLIRKPNGLRHAFCTYHFALHANENKTAQQAGNSPAMIHAHYKGLVTKAEAEKWFNVVPKI